MRTENGKIIPAMNHNKQAVSLRELRRKGAVSIGSRVCVMWGRDHFFGVVTGEYRHAVNGYEIGGHVWIVRDDAGAVRKVCHNLVYLEAANRHKN